MKSTDPTMRRIIPRAARIARALSLLLASAACARPSGEVRVDSRAIAASAASSSSSDAYSIYDLTSTWRDQAGATRQLSSLRGRPQVVAMIYTHCTTTCPITVSELKEVALGAGENVGFVLVSLDPARDTTAQLAAFAHARGLATPRWTMLGGSDDDVRELAAALGERYRRVSPTELAHTNTLTVLDAEGTVVWQRAGSGGASEALAALRELR